MLPNREGYEVTRIRRCEFSAGDRIMCRANGGGFLNGEIQKIDRIDGSRLHCADGRSLDAGKFKFVDHGYAVTSHKSQSKTVDHVIVAASRLNQKSAYVACSRGRISCSIHTPDKGELLRSLPAGTRHAALDFPQSKKEPVKDGRLAAWASKSMVRDLSTIRNLVCLNPKALLIDAAIRMGGRALQWWKDQLVDRQPELERRAIER